MVKPKEMGRRRVAAPPYGTIALGMGGVFACLSGSGTLAGQSLAGTNRMSNDELDVGFLGFAERAQSVREGKTNLFKSNILGLKAVLLSHFFPIALDGLYLGLVVRIRELTKEFRLRIRADTGQAIGWLNIDLEPVPLDAPSDKSSTLFLDAGKPFWSASFVQIPAHGFIVPKPGHYLLSLFLEGDGERDIGEFVCLLVDPLPLTPERKAAILPNPKAAKAFRAEFGCKSCSDQCRVYTALERSVEIEAEGWLWYQDIPEQFTCKCGKTTLDLTSVKRNFHGLLGHQLTMPRALSFVPLYQKSALEDLRTEFLSMLDRKPKEEVIQKFIEKHPIILHRFPAERLLFKPAILTFFKADFAIVTPEKDLIFIEIEPATKRLLTQEGRQAATLTGAFDQVRSWLHEVAEHRLAILDTLDIDRELVGKVRGVVIAGRDAGYDAKHLRRLKGADHGQVQFLTYDDLAGDLAALAHNVGEL